jgi:Flp pilus assembly protein TadG
MKYARTRSPKVNRSTRFGVAAVEFAFIAPLFMTLVLGSVEFARMIFVKQIMENAARAGARVATITGNTDTNVQSIVASNMTASGVTGYSWSVSPSLSTNPGSGTAMTVTASVPCSSVSWTNLFAGWFTGKTLQSTVVMTHE